MEMTQIYTEGSNASESIHEWITLWSQRWRQFIWIVSRRGWWWKFRYFGLCFWRIIFSTLVLIQKLLKFTEVFSIIWHH